MCLVIAGGRGGPSCLESADQKQKTQKCHKTQTTTFTSVQFVNRDILKYEDSLLFFCFALF